ncbi:MAG: molybdopterin-dependent oxidoreductase [Janthinobacterium lividum]
MKEELAMDSDEGRKREAGAEQGRQSSKPVAGSARPEAESERVRAGEQRPADPREADDVMTRRLPGREAADAAVLARSRQHTRRSFMAAAAGTAAAIGFYEWLERGPQVDVQPVALREAFEIDADVARNALPRYALAPTFPLSRAETLRVNGTVGLGKDLEPGSYRLQVVGVENPASRPEFNADVTAWEYQYKVAPSTEDKGHDTKTAPREGRGAGTAKAADTAGGNAPPPDSKADTSTKMAPAGMVAKVQEDEKRISRKPRGNGEAGESFSTLRPGTPGLLLTMDDIRKLPRRELVTEFKCIEGWSQVVHWGGVRMADFLDAYPPARIDGKEPRFAYFETPDGDYYCGYDLEVCRHPQTLLVTEMMGAPLTQNHGAPLRLHTPTKYGYKQIKRIGLIAYTNERPDDYWTELGYDWYAGL